MNQKEIAKHEKIKHGTIKNWFRVYGHDPVKVRARMAEYQQQGYNKKVKLYLYRDGNRYPVKEIQKKEPHLSVDFIKYRYRMCDEGDFDAIFAPHGSRVAVKENQKIWRRECANLGPRRSPESIKPPTDYERRLWTGDAY